MKLFGVGEFLPTPTGALSFYRPPNVSRRCWSSDASTLLVREDVRSSRDKQHPNRKNKPDGMSAPRSVMSGEATPLYAVNISTKLCAVCRENPCRFEISFLKCFLTHDSPSPSRRGTDAAASGRPVQMWLGFTAAFLLFPSKVTLVQQFSGFKKKKKRT